MEIQEQIKLKFLGVDFPSVQLNSTRSFLAVDIPVNIKLEPKAFLPKNSQTEFQVVFDVSIEVKDYFTLKVIALGMFEVSHVDESEEVRKNFINVNATAIMFPYIRAFISTLTSNIGNVMNPIILPTQFFKGELPVIPEPAIPEKV